MDFSPGNDSDDRHPCLLNFRADLVPYTFIVVFESLFNLLIVVAIAFNRSKLKHNHVYSYVTSLVMANVAMGILFTYTLVNYMVAFERTDFSHGRNASNRYNQESSSQRAIMTWWAFRKAFMVAFFLILSGNVSALIHGIANSAYFVGRSGGSGAKLRFRLLSTSGGASPTRENYGTVLDSRKRRAFVTILLTWVLPFFYSLPAAFGWNCIDHCDCLPGYYGGYRCISRKDPALCSRVWSPMTNAHLLLAAIIWFVELIMIGVNLFYALHKYYRTSVKPSHSSSFSKAESEEMTVANVRPGQRPTANHALSSETERNSTRQRFYRRPLHPTVKLLVLISAAYTLSTAPVMVCVVTDFIGSTTRGVTLVSDMLMTALSSLVVLYCFVCPVILIKYMPGLRTAIVRLLMPCTCVSSNVGSSLVRARPSAKKRQQNGQTGH